MKESESTWRTTFTPVVTGDIEHETGFDDFDAVYLAHRPHIDDGVQALATFIRTHAQISVNSEFVLSHGYQGHPTGGGRILGHDFIDILRGFLTLIFASSTVEFARRQMRGNDETEVVLEVRIFTGQYGDLHVQTRQQVESEGLEDTQSLDFLPDRYPMDKETGELLRKRFGLQWEPICQEADAPAA